ncbi:MAG: hypothetical protein BMS9Abin34_018 [Patescibacteria group bacterium]|nr:MAG: hypothetical protein BMS9Abin34_018 [Patescibacteria group bacterium]
MPNPALEGPITIPSNDQLRRSFRLATPSKFRRSAPKIITLVLTFLLIGLAFKYYPIVGQVLGVQTQGGSAVTLDRILDDSFNLSLAGYVEGKRLKSFATSGAPLTVSSTGLVTNLNSDFLDGQHGSYYLGATTLDSLDSTSFLRSDVSDSYTSGTLTFNSGTTLDVNGDFTIADTVINLDGGATTIQTVSGSLSLKGSGLEFEGTSASSDVEFFRDLANGGQGNNGLYLFSYNTGVGGTRSGRLWVTTTGEFRIDPSVSNRLSLDTYAESYLTAFESSAAGENREFRIYGWNTALAAPAYGLFQYDDTNDRFRLDVSTGDLELDDDVYITGLLDVVGTLTANGRVGVGVDPEYALHVRTEDYTGTQTLMRSALVDLFLYADDATPDTNSYNTIQGRARYYGGVGDTAYAIRALRGSVWNTGAGTITEAVGSFTTIRNGSTGTIERAIAFYTPGVANSSTGTIQNAYGMLSGNVDNTGGGTIVNNYGLYIEDPTCVGCTNTWSIYSEAGDNFFGGSVGIGTATPDGKLHVLSADSGAAPSTFADDFIVEGTGSMGMTLAANSSGSGNIYWANEATNQAASISYSHSSDSLSISNASGTHIVMGASELVINEFSYDNDFRIESDTSQYMFFLDGGNNEILIDASNTLTTADGTLHVSTASAGATSANAVADDLVVENSAEGGITILTPDTNAGSLTFGSSGGNLKGRIRYDHSAEAMEFYTNTLVRLYLSESTGFVINAGSTDFDTRIEGDTEPYLLFADAGSDRVGIGTNIPGARLEVKGATNDATAYALDARNSDDRSLFFARNDGTLEIGNALLTGPTTSVTIYPKLYSMEPSFFTNGTFLGLATGTWGYLSVVEDYGAEGIARIVDTGITDDAGVSVLRLGLGTITTGVATRFVTFYAAATTESDGTGVGRIRLNNGGVAYETGGADYAEYVTVSGSVSQGDIISIPSSAGKKALVGERVVGVVSDTAGFVGNAKSESPGPNQAIVGFIGQIRTKVTGNIKSGDLITASNIAGVGTKAEGRGSVVGIALESHSGAAVSKIKVFVNPGWWDPGTEIVSDGTAGADMNIPDQLKVLGVEAEVGIFQTLRVKVEAVFLTLRVKVAEIASAVVDTLKVGNLTIGEADAPAGITIYDRVTGEPYCVSISDGDWLKELGECE